jgi:UPF0755 protein
MKRAFTLILLLSVVVIAAVAVAGSVVWGRIHEPYKGYDGSEQFVEIPAGAGTSEIRRRLIDAKVIRDAFTFRAALRWTGRSQGLQAGEYRFDRPVSAVDAVEKIARGDVYGRRITFPEGLTIRDMARVYESRKFGKAVDFIKASEDASLIRDLDADAPDLEGYLFPETYTLPRGTPAAKLIALMVGRFRAAYPEELQARAREQGLSTRQVVALASLVEKETGKPEERPLVAAVYRNRHRIGMGMQADPTVIYALQKAGRYDGNIRRDDLDIDSPYNTYKYPGLPPGPIASPGRASLEATVRPADVTYLYFVSRNDGSHAFATTLAEHNRNVQQFQVLYFREKRQRERANQNNF